MALKAQELRNLSEAELREKYQTVKDTLLKLRISAKAGKIEQSSQLRAFRRDIARILTVVQEQHGQRKPQP